VRGKVFNTWPHGLLTGIFTFLLIILVPYNHSPLYAGLLAGLGSVLAAIVLDAVRRAK
jgi:hypothetical protein